MSFLCPQCAALERSLKSSQLIELPGDARSDEITLQVVRCSLCGFSGIAVYEESRRGALDQESFSHVGYRICEKDLAQIRELIRSCPQPKNPNCDCQAHRILGKKDDRAYWIGIKDIEKSDPFRMDL